MLFRSFGQQHLVFGKIEKEEEAKKEEALARRSSNAPVPGAKPKVRKSDNGAAPPEADGEPAEDPVPETAAAEASAEPPTKAPANRNQSASRAPRQGSKTKKRKR